MSASSTSFATKIEGFFKAVFSQAAIMLLLFLLTILWLINTAVKTLLPMASIVWMPYAAFSLIILLVGVIVWGFFLCISKIDTTESVTWYDHEGRKVVVKAPSNKMLPSIIDNIKRHNVKPDKLIPADIDLKSDPKGFLPLSESEKEKIVTEEATSALATAIKQPSAS